MNASWTRLLIFGGVPAQYRRPTPGGPERDEGYMAVRHRVFDRQRRHVPGERVRARSEATLRGLRGPVVGPNAPLLIRLVRRPYGLAPAAPTQVPDSARPDPSEPRVHPAAPRPPFLRRRLRDDPGSVPVGLEVE